MPDTHDEQDRLRNWYLARLRKRALTDASESSAWTPATLILADRARLEALIASRVQDANQNAPPFCSLPDFRLVTAISVLLYLLGGAAFALLLQDGHIVQASSILLLISICTTILLGLYWRSHRQSRELRTFLQQSVSQSGRYPGEQVRQHDIDELLSLVFEHITRLEERQNLIADYASDVICTLDESLRLLSISPGCNQAWERSPVEIVAHSVTGLFVPEDVKSVEEAFHSAKSKSGEFFVYGRIQRRSGRMIDTQWCVEWSNSENRYFAAVQDVTAQKEIQRVKDEFVAIVSHDLRSPITSVQWTLKLVEEGIYGDLNATGHKRLQEACRTVDFMLDLIADLLDLHRMETSLPRLVYTSVDYQDLVEDSIKAVEGMAESKNMKLIRRIAPGTCQLDKVRMKRVLINLLSNAIKFAPDDTTIEIEIKEIADNVTMMISDQGRGIRADLIDRLFDRFCNVGDPAARRDGSGLGLFASKAIVEAHRGSIKVESIVDQGTKFFVVLPTNFEEISTDVQLEPLQK